MKKITIKCKIGLLFKIIKILRMQVIKLDSGGKLYESKDKPQNNKNDKTKIETDYKKRNSILKENYIGAIFGAFILIISFLVLLCLGGKM